MAEFTRKELKKIFEAAEIEVPKDVLGQICDLHTTSNEDLTDKVKDLTEKLSTVERERDDAKAKAPKDGEEVVAKSEYDKLKTQYDTYKAEQDAKETKAVKEKVFKAFLKEIGVSEKRVDAITKVTNLDEVELDEDGKIKDSDKHKETITTEYADFMTSTTRAGAKVETPPANGGKQTMTKDQIMAIKDASARQKAIAENIHLFRKG